VSATSAVPLREPPLPEGRDFDGHPLKGLRYKRFNGELFAGRVSAEDVGQGDLGDCFFLSSLVAFAQSDPRALRRAIADNGDGTYTVTFQERKRGKVVALPVRVDTRFPVDRHGKQKFAKGLRSAPSGQELWPALFEKAYAAAHEGYVHINQGGDAGAAISSLSGRASDILTPSRHSAAALWQRIVRARAARIPLIAGTPEKRELAHRTGRSDLAGLIDDHYYAVVGAVERPSGRFIKLYTPLVDFTSAQVNTPIAQDNRQRRLTIALTDFRRDFDQLVINAPATRATRGRA
jgi:hypothetical protein